MNYFSNIEYLFLYLCCFSSFLLWVIQSKKPALFIAFIAITLGFFFKSIYYPSLIIVLIFFLLCKLFTKISEFNLKKFIFLGIIFFLISIIMTRKIPFSNEIPIFTNIQLSEISSQFSMGINLEKFICALIMASFLIPLARSWMEWKTIFKEFFFPFIILTLILITPAILTHFVKFNFKISMNTILFSLDSLFVVSFAEEVFFRGFLQNNIQLIMDKLFINKNKIVYILPILISSIIFAMFHLYGGYLLAAFAFIASIFYGYAYQKSSKIESAILVHFCFNLVHFVFFTYPSYYHVK